MSQLILHAGGREVTLDELMEVKAPPPEGRWFPLSHGAVLNKVKDTLAAAGFIVAKERLATSHEHHRFFGVLDMESELMPGVALSVGVRNSTDRTFKIGVCFGARTFVCDNLAFSAQIVVARKHTRHGEFHFGGDIAATMPKLGEFRAQEAQRLQTLHSTEVSNMQAESVILRAFEKGIVPAQLLGDIIREWRSPSFPEFNPRTLWSLASAFTTVLGREGKQVRNPNQYCLTTMKLNSLITPVAVAA